MKKKKQKKEENKKRQNNNNNLDPIFLFDILKLLDDAWKQNRLGFDLIFVIDRFNVLELIKHSRTV